MSDSNNSKSGAPSHLKSASGLAFGTLLSRATGFLRVLVLAYVLGFTRGPADAYNLANTTPNLVYDLVVGGIISATLIPVIVEIFQTQPQKRAWRSVSAITTVLVVMLLIASVALAVLAKPIVGLYAIKGADRSADQIVVATKFLRLFAPQVLFYGLIAIFTAILNAKQRFFAAGLTPAINNLVVIGVLLAAKMTTDNFEMSSIVSNRGLLLLLGLGTTAGVAAQMLSLAPSLLKIRPKLTPVWDMSDPGVRSVLRLSGWALGWVLTNLIAFMVMQILANGRDGDVSAYQSAYQFFQLPFALVSVSVLTAIMPTLTQHWIAGARREFLNLMRRSTKAMCMILIPSVLLTTALGHEIMRVLLAHGRLSAESANLTADIMIILSLGLPGFSLFIFTVRGLQAMKDGAATFWLYLLENGLNVIGAFALYPHYGVRGLAASLALAYSIAAIVGSRVLRRKAALRRPLLDRGLRVALIQMTVVAMLAAGIARLVVELVPASTTLGELARLGVALLAMGAVYFGFARRAGWLDLASLRRPARA